MRTLLAIGALSGLFAVVLGAFGALGLKSVLSVTMLKTFETGVRYHFIHTLIIVALPALAQYVDEKWLIRAMTAFLVGIVLFSGSLYFLSIFNWTFLGPVTPLGGLCFIIGWGIVFVGVLKGKPNA